MLMERFAVVDFLKRFSMKTILWVMKASEMWNLLSDKLYVWVKIMHGTISDLFVLIKVANEHGLGHIEASISQW